MSGKHPHKVLSTVRINSIKSKGRFADGNGLYLVVDPSGAKRWVLRTMVRGKRRDIGLGGLKLVSLAEAREKAAEFRKMAREGGDPVAERRKATKKAPTFKEAAKAVYESYKAAWKNPKHVAQWISSMEAYAFPTIGTLRVDEIETTDVMRVLSPIWLSKPETARRIRQRMKTTLDWAKASGFRSGDNPVEGVTSGLPKHTDRDNHFQAIPYKEVPKFVAAHYANTAEDRLPNSLIACIGGGSNAIGLFHPFLDEPTVEMYGVEAAGNGLTSGMHAASIAKGQPGVLHGNRTRLLMDDNGQIENVHSISAGLDYPGVGPEHAWLDAIGRVMYISATDEEAVSALCLCAELEGIIPALEPAHALARVLTLAPQRQREHLMVVNLCGRGDKDLLTISGFLRT